MKPLRPLSVRVVYTWFTGRTPTLTVARIVDVDAAMLWPGGGTRGCAGSGSGRARQGRAARSEKARRGPGEGNIRRFTWPRQISLPAVFYTMLGPLVAGWVCPPPIFIPTKTVHGSRTAVSVAWRRPQCFVAGWEHIFVLSI